jgi:DNA modification methylase
VNAPPSNEDLGLTGKESFEAQALATIKQINPDLHQKIRDGKAKEFHAVREVKRADKRRNMAEKAKAVAAAASPSWRIVCADCYLPDGLWTLPNGMAAMAFNWASDWVCEAPRLIFADPPYNIGVDYGDGPAADRLDDKNYLRWAADWVQLCHDRLTPDGSFWLLIGDEYAAEYKLLLEEEGFTVRAWIKWHETFGVYSAAQNNFGRCSRHLFYCVKDPKNYVFHAEAVRRPSDRQAKYNDGRADPAGKIWDDVWQIPRLVGTAAERIPDFPTQLPLALVRPIVLCCTDPGDLVVDPFSGSATTGVAAVEAGRRYVGFEKSKRFAELSMLRMKGVRPEERSIP